MRVASDGRCGAAVLGSDGGQPCRATAAAAAAQGPHALLLVRGDLPGDGRGAPRDGAHLCLPPARQAAIERDLHAGLSDEVHEGAVVLGAQRTQGLHRNTRRRGVEGGSRGGSSKRGEERGAGGGET